MKAEDAKQVVLGLVLREQPCSREHVQRIAQQHLKQIGLDPNTVDALLDELHADGHIKPRLAPEHRDQDLQPRNGAERDRERVSDGEPPRPS